MTDGDFDLEAVQRQFEQGIVVLLVDDQAIIGEAVRRMLAAHEDISFHFCQNPQEALARAAELKSDGHPAGPGDARHRWARPGAACTASSSPPRTRR